jgi:hypothetical protein
MFVKEICSFVRILSMGKVNNSYPSFNYLDEGRIYIDIASGRICYLGNFNFIEPIESLDSNTYKCNLSFDKPIFLAFDYVPTLNYPFRKDDYTYILKPPSEPLKIIELTSELVDINTAIERMKFAECRRKDKYCIIASTLSKEEVNIPSCIKVLDSQLDSLIVTFID